jgi:hypothetical protein
MGVSNDPQLEATLNLLATEGGLPLSTPDVDAVTGVGRLYYPADDQMLLSQQLDLIARQVTSCAFELGSVPPDPTNIAVLIDGHAIPRDPTNGWEYGAGVMSVVLAGTSCDQVRDGATHQIEAIFGCPTGTILIP